MGTLHNPIYFHLAEKILQALKKLRPESSASLENIYRGLAPPQHREMGHLCLACFPLAKEMKAAPPRIAQEIAPHIEEDELVKSVASVGPYLNFVFKASGVGKKIVNGILDGDFFKHPLVDRPARVMLEYSQPNTHKIIHVGHMRNLCLGDALAQICRYAGEEVVTATYPGDVGTHVAKCLWYLKEHCSEEWPENNRGEWLGEIYTLATNKYREQGEPPLTNILQQIHDQKGEYYQLWGQTRQWSVDLMKDVYAWAGVTFDHWFWESEVDRPSLKLAKKLYQEGFLVEDDGAIGMDLKDDKLGFCLLIKRDGTGLYATKDVELARRKLEEYGIEKSVYIVDNRQALHFRQVFKILQKMELINADGCFHLQYEMVELPDGPMSSRLGNIVPLTQLVREVESKIVRDYLQKYSDDSSSDWSEEEIKTVAQQVAAGAIKYGMIRIDNNRKIVFEMEEWLKLDGETGPYLQYVCARIKSLKRKLGGPTGNTDWEQLCDQRELFLMVQLGEFNNVLERCARELKAMPLCHYLYELGKLFNSFYAECPIAKAESKALKDARLALACAAGIVMEKGLTLLGIAAPEKM